MKGAFASSKKQMMKGVRRLAFFLGNCRRSLSVRYKREKLVFVVVNMQYELIYTVFGAKFDRIVQLSYPNHHSAIMVRNTQQLPASRISERVSVVDLLTDIIVSYF